MAAGEGRPAGWPAPEAPRQDGDKCLQRCQRWGGEGRNRDCCADQRASSTTHLGFFLSLMLSCPQPRCLLNNSSPDTPTPPTPPNLVFTSHRLHASNHCSQHTAPAERASSAPGGAEVPVQRCTGAQAQPHSLHLSSYCTFPLSHNPTLSPGKGQGPLTTRIALYNSPSHIKGA